MTQITIPQEEKEIIELLSTGHSYEEVQEHMQGHYPTDYSGKKLGYAVSSIQRRLGISNRIELGYKFAYDQCQDKIRDLAMRHEKELSKYSMEAFARGMKEASFELTGKDHNKGLMIGVISASLFWIIIFLILKGYGVI